MKAEIFVKKKTRVEFFFDEHFHNSAKFSKQRIKEASWGRDVEDSLHFCNQIFQHGAETILRFQHGAEIILRFQSQKCIWSKTCSKHGCYNLRGVICNHYEQGISWDASEINRFRFISVRDIFFASAIQQSQQLTPKSLLFNSRVWLKGSCGFDGYFYFFPI